MSFLDGLANSIGNFFTSDASQIADRGFSAGDSFNASNYNYQDLGRGLADGVNFLGNNAQGIGTGLNAIGGLAGAYTGYQAAKDAQGLADKQFAMLQADKASEVARRQQAQDAFTGGFSGSGLAAGQVNRKKQPVMGLASGGM